MIVPRFFIDRGAMTSSASRRSTFSDQSKDAAKQLANLTKQHKELAARFEQARVLARKYRLTSQNLEKENASLAEKVAQKSAASGDDTEANAELTKLRQESSALRTELEKYKQVTYR